jgi:hypothetical protein
MEIKIEIHPPLIGGSCDRLGTLHAEEEAVAIPRHLRADDVISARIVPIDQVAVARIITVERITRIGCVIGCDLTPLLCGCTR